MEVDLGRLRSNYHHFHRRLELDFSKKGLLALESQKRFLFDKGVITKNFDIDAWKDEFFLTQALRELKEEERRNLPY